MTESDKAPDLYIKRSSNKKTPDSHYTRADPSVGVGVYAYTCTPPGPDVHPEESDPEPVGPIAERVLEDLAARQAEALRRLRRGHTPRRPQ